MDDVDAYKQETIRVFDELFSFWLWRIHCRLFNYGRGLRQEISRFTSSLCK